MDFSVGSLVKVRGREWVVLPESEKELLMLRPLGGMDEEVTGIYLPLETVESAVFPRPDPNQIGDHRSCRLLRDAVRIGFRDSTGPFRSFGKMAVQPHPYQLVPLLMALKLDPVRILIGDDVGIGKTIESGLVARELLDRGEISRLVVLCPPHLAEQWQQELEQKFHIPAEILLPSTVNKLERMRTSMDQSLFDLYPFVVASIDYVKSDRRRDEFIRSCPEMVIVDEAHTCSYIEDQRSSRQQRNRLVNDLAKDPNRHLILVTATPHSGKEEAFRSLLQFLDPEFRNLPRDISGPENEKRRRHLAQHFVQRRRSDIRNYMETETTFPEREDAEETFELGDKSEYKKLFEQALNYARESVADPEGGKFRQRIRWWSALALLRSLASSPAAAAQTLRNRAAAADTRDIEEADEIGRRRVMDIDIEDSADGEDVVAGSDPGDEDPEAEKNRRKLQKMARAAEKLEGKNDPKLKKAVKLVKEIVEDGYQPIVFCRFIPTAEYVAEAFRTSLPKEVAVSAVTGLLPPTEREARVLDLSDHEKRVLVCTDCLSEGINLQENFNAVMHYDLSWNPTRHEQREGRVDRFGQARPKVRVLTYYGVDNQIDGIVLDVLLRKHKAIRKSLGVSVPVPADTEMVVEAIFEGLLLRERSGQKQLTFDFMEDQKKAFHAEWEKAEDREKRSRTMFAQHAIKVDEVAKELKKTREAIGSGVDVKRFVQEVLSIQGAVVTEKRDHVELNLYELPSAMKDALGVTEVESIQKVRFALPVEEKVKYLSRTHPFVESMASYVMNATLDPLLPAPARRCGVIRTQKVERQTTLLLVRFRYHLITKKKNEEKQLLAEECRLMGFRGAPGQADWLAPDDAEALLSVSPEQNITGDIAKARIESIEGKLGALDISLETFAKERSQQLLEDHRRIRTAAKAKGIRYDVKPHLPPDILGIYVFLPTG